jgi:hypothetical protein
MKVVLVAGEPATGKSTLARALMKELGFGIPFKEGLVAGTRHRLPGAGYVCVVGVYGPVPGFWGTDKLSMALLPSLKSWLADAQDIDAVFMEGDRVTSKSFISYLQAKYDLTLVVLTASPGTLEKRQKVRGNLQSEIFLKGRRTKINNIVDTCLAQVFHEPETSKVCDFILDKLGASKKEVSTFKDQEV